MLPWPRPPPILALNVVFGKLVPNPSCVPNLKLLASTVVEIRKGSSGCICTKFGLGGPLADVINCAELCCSRLMGFDSVGVKIRHLLISCWLGRSPLTQCWRHRAACEKSDSYCFFYNDRTLWPKYNSVDRTLRHAMTKKWRHFQKLVHCIFILWVNTQKSKLDRLKTMGTRGKN